MNAYLFVCTYNVGRSATCEHIARQMGYAADSAGIVPQAVRPLTLEAVERAETIVCMEEMHAEAVLRLAPHRKDDVQVWHIPEEHGYGSPDLVKFVRSTLRAKRSISV